MKIQATALEIKNLRTEAGISMQEAKYGVAPWQEIVWADYETGSTVPLKTAGMYRYPEHKRLADKLSQLRAADSEGEVSYGC